MPERPADRGEGAGILGLFGRRPRRPARCAGRIVCLWRMVHQYAGVRAHMHPFQLSRRGIGLEKPPFGRAPAGACQKCADGEGAGEPVAPPCVRRGQRGDARLRGRPCRECQGKCIGGQGVFRPIRPFDQRRPIADRLIEADILKFVRTAEAIEIEMRDLQPAEIIGLHQREGRARDFQLGVIGECSQQGAAERGFSRPEIACQRDDVAGREQNGQILGQSDRRGLIGTRNDDGRSGGLSHGQRPYPWAPALAADAGESGSGR